MERCLRWGSLLFSTWSPLYPGIVPFQLIAENKRRSFVCAIIVVIAAMIVCIAHGGVRWLVAAWLAYIIMGMIVSGLYGRFLQAYNQNQSVSFIPLHPWLERRMVHVTGAWQPSTRVYEVHFQAWQGKEQVHASIQQALDRLPKDASMIVVGATYNRLLGRISERALGGLGWAHQVVSAPLPRGIRMQQRWSALQAKRRPWEVHLWQRILDR
ncbi:hypothetical protein [Alicyclobacillus sp. SP_1]|uniref:hypothetical protein n=1 Tax=Alicyclobacillus sp. SP_1 TaxID=2942475 RepID=UPI002157847C|nr:hypothetical protein [Alicyclobacillus sp. SP_1]